MQVNKIRWLTVPAFRCEREEPFPVLFKVSSKRERTLYKERDRVRVGREEEKKKARSKPRAFFSLLICI